MEQDDDEDLKLVRASAQLLADFELSLPRALWKRPPGPESRRRVHRYVRQRDYVYLNNTLEPFQGEPQLLDPKLIVFIPQLLEAYLEHLISGKQPPQREQCVTLDFAVAGLLYTLCKIRGEKIISGFFNNEARYLNTILPALEAVSSHSPALPDQWKVSYVLTLWLGHLLLTPFDLSTVVVDKPVQEHDATPAILPQGMPRLAVRISQQLFAGMSSRTRLSITASKALVRLVNRPDMQKFELAQHVFAYGRNVLDNTPMAESVGQDAVGCFHFLVNFSAGGADTVAAEFYAQLWSLCTKLFDRLFTQTDDSSAVHRKKLVRLMRNMALGALKEGSVETAAFADENGVLEEIIDKLLQCLGDLDTQVRFAAAKAIGSIVSHLDQELASEVLQAIIDGYNLGSSDNQADFAHQDPARWHGLTLALAHALFRRTAIPQLLPAIMSVLLPALNFQKRAVTGNALGANVRDAACFAIWSISRRYTTDELLAIDLTQLQVAAGPRVTIIQYLAIEVMVAACLDPNGNIRRGCSAALQEMVGRHPDHVKSGIDLVQIVDYLAVGLRRRGLFDLVVRASGLNQDYCTAFLANLQGWRGLGSPDIASRMTAGKSLAALLVLQPRSTVAATIKSLFRQSVNTSTVSHVEQRHGALCALSSIVDAFTKGMVESISETPISNTADVSSVNQAFLTSFRQVSWLASWSDKTPRAVAAEMPAAVLRLLRSVIDLGILEELLLIEEQLKNLSLLIAASLARSDESLLHPAFSFTRSFVQRFMFTSHGRDHLARLLPIQAMVENVRTDSKRTVVHGAARAFAVAAAFDSPGSTHNQQILACLTDLASAPTIERRVLGFRSIHLLIQAQDASDVINPDLPLQLSAALLTGLNDYTITERGDVGSLARTQALHCILAAWRPANPLSSHLDAIPLRAAVLRLSLEKLDRVRLLAAQVLASAPTGFYPALLADGPVPDAVPSVSNEAYFATRFAPLSLHPDDEDQAWIRAALVRGLASSGGAGAEHLLRAARGAITGSVARMTGAAAGMFLASLSGLLRTLVDEGSVEGGVVPALELLAWALDCTPLVAKIATAAALDVGGGGSEGGKQWRTLLGRVQRAHYKSASAPRLLAAVEVYRCLGRVDAVAQDVERKLVEMIGGNPVARVRYAAAEALWCLTGKEGLVDVDWMRAGTENRKEIKRLSLSASR